MTPHELKQARRRLGMTQNQLAEAVGVSDGRTVRRWEAGVHPIPETVERLIYYLISDSGRDVP